MTRWRFFRVMSRSETDLANAISRSLVPGAAAGVVAYIVSYVVLFLFLLVEGGNILQEQAIQAVGWVFYGAHNVDVTVTAAGQSQSQNVLQTLTGVTTIPVFVYYLVPIAVLVAAGYLVASRVQTGGDVAAAAAAGATVTIGYLVLAIAGTFLFAIGSAAASAGPDRLTGVLIAGLAYPLVFGAVGGAIEATTE